MDAQGRRIYLDHAASAPLDPRAAAAIAAIARGAANPSSIHAEGRFARDALEGARRAVATLVGGAASDLVFTSGGSEADALGLIGLYRAARAAGAPARIAVGAAGHPALIGAARALEADGAELAVIPVDRDGRSDGAALERALERGVAAIGLSRVNHELGTIEDGGLIARCRAAGVRVLLDAVQAVGRLPVGELGVGLGADAIALSAHKLGGPAGSGALWIRDGVDLGPLVGGGHQERGRRPGSENLIGAVGFAAVVPAAAEALAAAGAIAARRDRLERGCRAIEGARVHGGGAPRAAGHLNVGFAGAPGDALVAALDLDGVAAATGAACASGTTAPSPVLLACGYAATEAGEAVRFSLGTATTDEEIERVVGLLPEVVARVRRFSR